MRCSAYGCQKVPGKNGLFCQGCWQRLPEDLRGPAAAQKAVVHLAKLDGYLVDAPKSAPRVIHDAGRGLDYV
jgi:hypothetical protein